MGEAASDGALNRGDGTPGLGLAVTLGLDVALFVGALVWQLAVRRYIPAVYWLAVAMVAVFGTGVADILAYVVGVPLWLLCTVTVTAIGVNFAVWYARERTLTFWVAYILTRPLGASFADWFSVSPAEGGLGLGAGWVALVMTAVIAGLVGHVTRRHRVHPDRPVHDHRR